MNPKRLLPARVLKAATFVTAVIATTVVTAHAESILPSITINTAGSSGVSESEVFAGMKLVTLFLLLGFLPSLVMVMTCFTRFAIILSMTRHALGTMQTPPNQVILGLALFLTFAVMQPIFGHIWEDSLVPYMDGKMGHAEAFEKAFVPLREFMLRHTRESDLALFIEVTKTELPPSPEDLGPQIVIPAFVLSELNTSFQIAFLIFLPFLILDMIISSVLTSMSMITLPPTVVSLPVKLMLFVLIDGWHLIIGNLVKSYEVVQ